MTSASSASSFGPGPVFANVVLVDEINRASPKTQSGLLECMQERRVTVDVQTHELARPFLVLATQNPFEYEGTYPLPEAQVDRFMVRLSLGYPDRAAEAGHVGRARDRRSGAGTSPGGDRRRGARRAGRGRPGARLPGAARLHRQAAVANPRGSARRSPSLPDPTSAGFCGPRPFFNRRANCSSISKRTPAKPPPTKKPSPPRWLRRCWSCRRSPPS